MAFAALPPSAAWQHRHARHGFEVTYFHPHAGGLLVEGRTTAVEDSHAWDVSYTLQLDETWRTRQAQVSGRSVTGSRSILLQADGTGRWLLDGHNVSHLDGCLDVDLESSAMTNAFPIHRLRLPVGDRASCPAAYVRALDLSVQRLEQTYERLPDTTGHQRYEYTAPTFQFTCHLTYDDTGLLLEYPGIATRAAIPPRVQG
jgi:uncharacterized protein